MCKSKKTFPFETRKKIGKNKEGKQNKHKVELQRRQSGNNLCHISNIKLLLYFSICILWFSDLFESEIRGFQLEQCHTIIKYL